MRVSSVDGVGEDKQRRGIWGVLLYPMRMRDMARFGFTDVLFPDRSDAPEE